MWIVDLFICSYDELPNVNFRCADLANNRKCHSSTSYNVQTSSIDVIRRVIANKCIQIDTASLFFWISVQPSSGVVQN